MGTQAGLGAFVLQQTEEERQRLEKEGRGKAWVSPVVFCCLCLFLALAPKALQHISSQSQWARRDSRERQSGRSSFWEGVWRFRTKHERRELTLRKRDLHRLLQNTREEKAETEVGLP